MLLLIWGLNKAKYFSPRDWTTQISLKLLAKFVFTRRLFWVGWIDGFSK